MKIFNKIKSLYSLLGIQPKSKSNTVVDSIGSNTINNSIIEKRNPKSKIKFGSNSTISGRFVLNCENSLIEIGNNVSIGNSSIFECALEIIVEDDVLISYQCIIQDSNNHSLNLTERVNDNLNWNRKGIHDWTIPISKKVIIGRGSWLGARAIILKGVELGEGCIVGAGSVVTKSFPAWSIIGGNPAKLIRTLTEEER